MKHVLAWMFLLSITGSLFAQKNNNRAPLQIEKMRNYKRSYFLDLKEGNALRLDMYGADGRTMQMNFDSLVNRVAESITLIKDSLGSPVSGRTITISMFDTVARQIQWVIHAPAEKHLVYYENKTKEIKATLDTVILNVYSFIPATVEETPYIRLNFYLNNVKEFGRFDNNSYNEFFHNLQPDNSVLWALGDNGLQYLRSNPALQILKVYDPVKLTIRPAAEISLSLQNYQDHLTTSFNTALGITAEQYYIVRQYLLGYESNFSWKRNQQDKSETFVNGFLTLSYRTRKLLPAANNVIGVFPYLKLGYLLKRKGEIYDTNTFRLTFGQFELGGHKLRVEPTIYFSSLLKNIQPSFRVTQAF